MVSVYALQPEVDKSAEVVLDGKVWNLGPKLSDWAASCFQLVGFEVLWTFFTHLVPAWRLSPQRSQ